MIFPNNEKTDVSESDLFRFFGEIIQNPNRSGVFQKILNIIAEAAKKVSLQ
jgi:hypothetical protein